MSEHENMLHTLLMPVPYEREPAVTWRTWVAFAVFVTFVCGLGLAFLIGLVRCLTYLSE